MNVPWLKNPEPRGHIDSKSFSSYSGTDAKEPVDMFLIIPKDMARKISLKFPFILFFFKQNFRNLQKFCQSWKRRTYCEGWKYFDSLDFNARLVWGKGYRICKLTGNIKIGNLAIIPLKRRPVPKSLIITPNRWFQTIFHDFFW